MSTTSLSPNMRYLRLSLLPTESLNSLGKKLKANRRLRATASVEGGGVGGQISNSLYVRQSPLANVVPVNTGLHNNLFRFDCRVGRENAPTFRAPRISISLDL